MVVELREMTAAAAVVAIIVVLTAEVTLVCGGVVPTVPNQQNQIADDLSLNSSEQTTEQLNSDQENAGDDNTTNTGPNWRLIYRQREREEQLILIQLRILNGLGISQPPNISAPVFTEEERERMRSIFNKAMNVTEKKFTSEQPYVQRLQSFYPSCSLPKNTDTKLWERVNKFYIYYKVDQALGDGIDVTSATLRLWKNVQNNEDNTISQEPEPVHPWFGSSLMSSTEELESIKTSIYAIVRPVNRSRKIKRRFVYSRTSSASESGWQEFNVKTAVKGWLNGQRNFGFEVKVQNDHGVPLDPHDFYSHINCSSSEINMQPFPNIIENLPELAENESFPLQNKTYPTLDLHTIMTETLDHTSRQQVQEVIPITNTVNNTNESDVSETSIRDKRSPCSCQIVDYQYNIEELGLDFIVEPKVLRISVCSDFEHDAEESNCRSSQSSDITLKYEDNDGQLQDVTIAGVNVTQCLCAYQQLH